jgi:hypothetical protein
MGSVLFLSLYNNIEQDVKMIMNAKQAGILKEAVKSYFKT